jgi:hypothetical protein
VALVALATVGCSSSEGSLGTNKDNLSSNTTPGFGKVSGGSALKPADCTQAATYAYVVSEQNDLYRFDPPALSFTKIGALGCQAGSATPFSMAVDRTGIAWVNYSDGSLFRVSTADAACEKTSFKGPAGFTTFGMGFSTDGSAAGDSLFVIGCQVGEGVEKGFGLGRIDTTTLTATTIGTLGANMAGKCGELTGTGDGRLYGLFAGVPATLGKIESATSNTTVEKSLASVKTDADSAYAFSFWGGDFWFYTARDQASSKVTRYKAASDGTIADVVPDVGFTIVGAGVSTCAPTGPVN